MTMFKVQDDVKAEQYCIKNVGKRLFWLHRARGGEGWMIRKDQESNSFLLTIDDEKKALLAALYLSDQ